MKKLFMLWTLYYEHIFGCQTAHCRCKWEPVQWTATMKCYNAQFLLHLFTLCKRHNYNVDVVRDLNILAY